MMALYKIYIEKYGYSIPVITIKQLHFWIN
jgi:hypothetical protein